MPKNKPVVLSCLHMFDGEPVPRAGDLVWCYKCAAYRTYVTVEAEQRYTLKCDTCLRVNSKTKVGGPMQAQIKAEQHARSLPGHTVTITDNEKGETLAVITPKINIAIFED